MSTLVLLVRHAAHEDLGVRLSGRGPAPGLGVRGRREAEQLTAFLAKERIAAVHSSPRTRAQETAAAIAAPHDLAVQTADALDEVDFGEWTGQRYDALDGRPEWERWNRERGSARALGGESMSEAQERALGHVRQAGADYPGATVALVSHCDIIRAVIAGVLGLSLDHLLRFDVDPASVSRLVVGDWGTKVASINERAFA